MSRTYRRKSGDRYWKNQSDFEFPRKTFKNIKEVQAYFETDRLGTDTKRNNSLKKYSNKARRVKEREQLYKVVNKNDLDVHTYDDSHENAIIRRIIWEYF